VELEDHVTMVVWAVCQESDLLHGRKLLHSSCVDDARTAGTKLSVKVMALMFSPDIDPA
jgi:hypothetical protein